MATMFAHPFVRDAYLAGTFVALACGTVGWFAVLRGQVFATDALSHVAFVGAIAAAVIGVDERVGLFALTLMVAAGLGVAGERTRADDTDTVTGIALAWVLGIGVLLLAVLATRSGGASGVTTANTLFGSIYSLSPGGARLAAVVAAVITGLLWAGARPLLLASLEPELAVLRGVPVRLLAAGFMAALAAVTAESTEAVGALLLLGLIAAPAGASRALTARPYAGLALSAGIAVAAMWGGLALAYAIPRLPPSPAIIALAAGAYLGAALTARLRRRRRRARAGDRAAING